MKVIALDIETTGLVADGNIIWCAAIAEYSSRRRPRVLTAWTATGEYHRYHERRLIAEVAAACKDADAVLTYYGSRFDLPFLQARAVKLRRPFDPPTTHFDIYYLVRSTMRLRRRGLGPVGRFINAPTCKPGFPPSVIGEGRRLSRRVRQSLTTRCAADAQLTIEVAGAVCRFVRAPKPGTRLARLRKTLGLTHR